MAHQISSDGNINRSMLPDENCLRPLGGPTASGTRTAGKGNPQMVPTVNSRPDTGGTPIVPLAAAQQHELASRACEPGRCEIGHVQLQPVLNDKTFLFTKNEKLSKACPVEPVDHARRPDHLLTSEAIECRGRAGYSAEMIESLQVLELDSLGNNPDPRAIADLIAGGGSLDIAVAFARQDQSCATELVIAAARHGKLDMLKALIEIGSWISLFAIDWAVERGHLDVVRCLLALGPKPAEGTLAIAAESGNLAILDELLAHQVPLSAAALERAASKHHEAVIRRLCEHQVPIDRDIFIHLADDPVAVKLLIDASFYPTQGDLAVAIQGNHEESAILMLNSKAELETSEAYKKQLGRAIAHAATHCKVRLLRLLIRHGIEVAPAIEEVAARFKNPAVKKSWHDQIAKVMADA